MTTPNNAWARLQDVQDMIDSGMRSPQDGRRLLDQPDKLDLGDAIRQSERRMQMDIWIVFEVMDT